MPDLSVLIPSRNEMFLKNTVEDVLKNARAETEAIAVLDGAWPAPPLEQHPLVVHYGLPLEALALTRAHRRVEGTHRAAAWRIVLDHVPVGERAGVVAAMEAALGASTFPEYQAQNKYRDPGESK